MQKKYRMLVLVSATAATLVANAGSLTSPTSLSQINDFHPERHSANKTVTNRFSRLPWTRVAMDSHATTPSGKVSTVLAGNTLSETKSTHKESEMAENMSSTDRARIPRVLSDITLGLGKIMCDAWVATKVKLALMFSDNLNSAHIFIKTSNGIVTLAGNVPSETEYGMAIDVANQVHGVNSVNTPNLVFPNEFQQFTIQDPENGLFLF